MWLELGGKRGGTERGEQEAILSTVLQTIVKDWRISLAAGSLWEGEWHNLAGISEGSLSVFFYMLTHCREAGDEFRNNRTHPDVTQLGFGLDVQ